MSLTNGQSLEYDTEQRKNPGYEPTHDADAYGSDDRAAEALDLHARQKLVADEQHAPRLRVLVYSPAGASGAASNCSMASSGTW